MKWVLKHRLPTRWFHWINFAALAVMIWSGFLIYWANDVYTITIADREIFRFFPDEFSRLMNIDHRLAEGMAYHFVFVWLFALNGLLYAGYTLFSGEWRKVAPSKRSPREALQVVLHDLHFRKTLPPQGVYNAAQRIAYTLIIFAGLGSLLTGLAIYKPIQLGGLLRALGGYEWTRWEHFWLTWAYIGFLVIHVVQVVRAGWPNFRSMVIGYDVAPTQVPPEGGIDEKK